MSRPPSRGLRGIGDWLISGDRPGHPATAVLLVLVFAALLFAPFLFPGSRALAAASRICIFILLAGSYDIMLGYTGIVSFAHTMFFGIGAYAVAIPLSHGIEGWGGIAGGILLGICVASVVAAFIGLLSLRVQAIYFSMITLAVASFAQLLATQLRDLTGGEDGLTFSVPGMLSNSYRPFADPVLGLRIDGRIITYYLVFATTVALFLLMLRLVNSSFGQVLKAVRENEFRTEALGYRVVIYRTLASVWSAAIAACAGALMAIVLRYTGPESTLSFSLMVDVLLMVVIGGMGTMYGAVLGAVLIVLAQYYLQPGLQSLHDALAYLPFLAALLHPDRWLLWLGVMFLLIVYFFPAGITGSLNQRARR